MTITFQKQTLHLHPFRAIFWEEQDALLIADLHLGKAAHFRKHGLAVPAVVLQKNLENLQILIDTFAPQRVIFLGDLFHSTLNYVWQYFVRFMENYGDLCFELVQGNHDILPPELYAAAQLTVYTEPLVVEAFIFSHYPLEEVPARLYNFYGHLHPGVKLSGYGGQSMRLPCFHFGKRQAVLPAFGKFTGLAIVRPVAGDQVFVIGEGQVFAVETG